MSDEALIDKSIRLIRQKKVTHAPAARTYLVEGDHGMYVVTVIETQRMQQPASFCNCPAQHDPCSHMLAALMVDKERSQ